MRRSQSGRSARARFNQLCRENLPRQWREWVALVGIAIAGVAMAAGFDGATQLIGAWLVAFACAIAGAGWLLAFDVDALTWIWGSIGERVAGHRFLRAARTHRLERLRNGAPRPPLAASRPRARRAQAPRNADLGGRS
jgi:hypothetical protein